MVSKRFYLQTAIRLFFLSATISGFVLSVILLTSEDLFTIIGLGALSVLQFYLFLRYLNRANREIKNFFLNVSNSDYEITPNVDSLYYFPNLKELFDDLLKQMIDLRRAYQEQNLFFKVLTENLGVGLLVFDGTGKVELVNPAGLKIIGVNQLRNLKQLEKSHKDFLKELLQLKAGDSRIIEIHQDGRKISLASHITKLKFENQSLTLMAFQDIQSDLVIQEFEAWKNLIRVISHEINNSIGPISSTIDTLENSLQLERQLSQNQDISAKLEKTLRGLEIIKERSTGLMHFVNQVKSIRELPKPVFKDFKVEELINEVYTLMERKLANVRFVKETEPENLQIFADKNMIQQVLINLIQNAVEAADGKDVMITFRARMENKHTVFELIDNGRGMPEDMINRIFIPYFTTKEKGSGIGLSLVRQIMILHHGNVEVKSEEGGPTCFKLVF